MMKLRNIISIGIVMALLSVSSAFATYHVGDTVANWTLNDADGNPVSLYDFMGMVVFINFWSAG